MHAIDVILRDHEKIKALLQDITNLSKDNNNRNNFFNELMTLCELLLRHETMEQKLFYPALEKFNPLKDKIDHLINEEKKAEKIIKKLSDSSLPFNEQLKLFIALKKEVLHHAGEEEKFFPKVRELVPENVLIDLGNEMQAFKNKAKHPKL